MLKFTLVAGYNYYSSTLLTAMFVFYVPTLHPNVSDLVIEVMQSTSSLH